MGLGSGGVLGCWGPGIGRDGGPRGGGDGGLWSEVGVQGVVVVGVVGWGSRRWWDESLGGGRVDGIRAPRVGVGV